MYAACKSCFMKTWNTNSLPLAVPLAVVALHLSVIQPAQAGFFANTGSMTTARVYHTATLLPNGQVLVVGGYVSSTELYDPATRTWTATSAMTTARTKHTATLLPNDQVLVTGGGGEQRVNSLHRGAVRSGHRNVDRHRRDGQWAH